MLDPPAAADQAFEWSIRKVCPVPSANIQGICGKKAFRVTCWIKRIEAAVTPIHGLVQRIRRGLPVANDKANGLVQMVQFVFHVCFVCGLTR